MTLVILLSLLIGLLLGLLGGGGSILTVPVLVYLVGLEPKTAIATSLVVVGVTSFTAMLSHARGGRVCWKTGAVFGLAGMFGAYLGGRLAAFIPSPVLLLLFASIMLGTAWAMLKGRRASDRRDGLENRGPLCPAKLPLAAISFDGLMVGTLTGLVGAGGGFLVVPALNLLGGLPMHAAVGTSLLVIGMKSFAALAGYATHVSIDLKLVALVTSAAIVGSLIGGLLSHRIRGPVLRQGFGVFVVLIASYLFYKELNLTLVDNLWQLFERYREFLLGIFTMLMLLSLYRLRGWIQSHHH